MGFYTPLQQARFQLDDTFSRAEAFTDAEVPNRGRIRTTCEARMSTEASQLERDRLQCLTVQVDQVGIEPERFDGEQRWHDHPIAFGGVPDQVVAIDGQIDRLRDYQDHATIMQQLGLVSMAKEAGA